MGAFLVGAALAVVLAVGSGFVLESYLAETALERFSAPSARVAAPRASGEARELPGEERPRS